MERYDGKTRKDDIIRNIVIVAAVAATIIGLNVLMAHLKSASKKDPDMRVVVGTKTAFNSEMREDLEAMFKGLVEDRNNDGEVVIDIQFLRLVDAQTLTTDEGVNAVSSDDDFQRMQLYLSDGEHFLFLLSDEPSGDFKGAATTYSEAGFFCELPGDMADSDNPYRENLSSAPFVEELGLEDTPF